MKALGVTPHYLESLNTLIISADGFGNTQESLVKWIATGSDTTNRRSRRWSMDQSRFIIDKASNSLRRSCAFLKACNSKSGLISQFILLVTGDIGGNHEKRYFSHQLPITPQI